MLDLPSWCYAVVQLLGAATLLFRRSNPVHITFVNAALCLVSPTQASYVAIYSLSAYTRRTTPAVISALALVACWSLGAQQWRLVDPVSSLVLLACALLIGLWVRARRALLDSLTERAERAEREQRLASELAVANDRARLAVDVHDTVGHWISLMVLQAGALEVTTTDTETKRSAGVIQAHGGQAIAELRGVLEELRSADAPELSAGTTAGIPSLAELIDRARQAGLSVTARSLGYPMQPDDPLTTTAYRIIQESLTNATRHAPGSQVTVVIEHGPNETVVEVTNGAPLSDELPSADDYEATGLLGLRHRVTMINGQLDTGHVAGGGFRVRAILPAPPGATVVDR